MRTHLETEDDRMPSLNTSSIWHRHFNTQARHHVWATHRLLDAVSAVSDEHYKRDVGLFFQSIQQAVRGPHVVARLGVEVAVPNR